MTDQQHMLIEYYQYGTEEGPENDEVIMLDDEDLPSEMEEVRQPMRTNTAKDLAVP